MKCNPGTYKYLIPEINRLNDVINSTGPTGCTGASGSTSGLIIYLNYSVQSSITSYKSLDQYQTNTGATTSVITIPSLSSNNNLVSFVSVYNLNTLFIPPGLWDINIFASTTDNLNTSIIGVLYKRDISGNETEIVRSLSVLVRSITPTPAQYTLSFNVPYTALLAAAYP